MITQDIYQKTIKFAGEAHKNQLVPGTESNYLLHLSNVAMEVLFAYMDNQNFDLNFAVQLALLHDTVEDTEVTYNELTEKFDTKIGDGVLALTKNKNLDKKIQLADSLDRILKQPSEVSIVKLADRITNLQKPPIFWNVKKRKIYLKQAFEIFKSLSGNNIFLAKRLEIKIKEYEQYIFDKC
ncbi:MAG: HD domain-containing protein [Bacteroidota bacterium]